MVWEEIAEKEIKVIFYNIDDPPQCELVEKKPNDEAIENFNISQYSNINTSAFSFKPFDNCVVPSSEQI